MRTATVTTFLAILFAVLPMSAQADDLRIENGLLSVAFDPDTKVFTLGDDKGVFAQSTMLHGEIIQASVEKCDLKSLGGQGGVKGIGPGRAIRVEFADGSGLRVMLFPEVPFALVRRSIQAGKDQTRVIDSIRPVSFIVESKENAKDSKVLGTAGLTDPDGHPGSYAFLAVASPKTREGVVAGWISSDRGSGILFTKTVDGKVQVDAQVDYGRMVLGQGRGEAGEILAVGRFDDARLGLEAYADLIAQYHDIHLPPIPCGYCTWYSNPYGGACDEKHLEELAKDAGEKLVPYGFDFIQIDDKWQLGERRNGPAKCFFTHHPKGPYPGGMKKPAEMIHSLGMTPGIWFMPFAADREDPFFKERWDWLVKDADGKPCWAHWGGTTLDTTRPEVRDYLRDVVRRIAKDWGYTYFKMDGLWMGTGALHRYVNNAYVTDDQFGRARFADEEKTPIEVYRDGLKLVREAAGDDVFLLGCNVSQNMRTMAGSYGLLDAMRIGPDNGSGFKPLKEGPWHGSNRYFLHGRVWYNDPDPLYVRPSMPIEHALLIASWVTLTGQLNTFSEWLPGLPEDRLEILRRTMPNHGLKPRPVDLFENPLPQVWLLTDTRKSPRRDVVGLFNWEEKTPVTVDRSLEEIGLPEGRYVGFDFWTNEFVAPLEGRLKRELPGGTCAVIALRQMQDRPVVVSTSRHLTQGVVDIVEEKWDAGKRTLSGVSRVVGGDPYELRIVVPSEKWRVKCAKQGRGEAAKSATWTQDGTGIRVILEAEKNEEVCWEVEFEE